MALNAYLTLNGETQGDIRGPVTPPGGEESIVVIAVSHRVSAATDSAGVKRQHGPLVITKEVDKTSPLLYAAWVNHETITDWTLRYWQPSHSGQEEQHYTIQLVNAKIVSIEHEMLNNRVPETAQQREREHVSFAYQTIRWEWVETGTTAQDTVLTAPGAIPVEQLAQLIETSRTETGDALASMQAGLEEMGDPSGQIMGPISRLSAALGQIRSGSPLPAQRVAEAERLVSSLRMDLQDSMQKQSALMQALSNVMRQMHDTARAIIQNMR